MLSSAAVDPAVSVTCDLDACQADIAPEVVIRMPLSMGRVTLIFIVPSCNLAIGGIDGGLPARELCVKSRNSPADIGSLPSCNQGVGAGVAGPLGLGGGGEGLFLCVTT